MKKKKDGKTEMFQENCENIDMSILEHGQLRWQVENVKTL